MYRILSASKDTYITNKITNSNFRAKDSNVGNASTLDLFKLYDESVSGSSPATELSRLLVKFDLSKLIKMKNEGKVDINDSSFQIKMHLRDVYGGQTTPSNFKLIVFPLAKNFEEGIGRDIVTFKDIDVANFITASMPNPTSQSAATATLTVSDGDDNSASNLPLEKSSITIVSTQGIERKYAVVDGNQTTVTTGDVLDSDSDTGTGTAGSSLAGAIAVAINLTGTVSTQNNLLVQLKAAIENSNGHNGKITVSSVPSVGDGAQSITLTQSITGYDGNRVVENNLVKLTSTDFTGGIGGAIRWHREGAMRSGSLGSTNIDVIVSGTLEGPNGINYVNLSREQLFKIGDEDLEIDVTEVVSGTITNQISDNGFCIAYSGSFEKDNYSYFVKRFGSNQSLREDLRPHLSLRFDDSIQDNHRNFTFDRTGSIYLNNYYQGTLSNLLSGASATPIVGHNCLKIKIESGSYQKIITASQYSVGGVFQTGVYSASFAVSSFGSTMFNYLKKVNSASFDAVWSPGTDAFSDRLDGKSSFAYLSSSLVINRTVRTSFNGSQKRILVTLKNLKNSYNRESVTKIRVFAEDRDREIVFKKTPFETESQVFNLMYYRIVDAQTGEIIIPFDTEKNSTKLSTDSEGMYFKLYMDGLLVGRSYRIEFLIKDFESDELIKDVQSIFTILN